jgi:hypothetical protein
MVLPQKHETTLCRVLWFTAPALGLNLAPRLTICVTRGKLFPLSLNFLSCEMGLVTVLAVLVS